MEQWKSIDGEYEVSDGGRVRKGSRLLKVNPAGQVWMHGKQVTVARLVANAFLKRPAYPVVVVRCRDGDRTNLSASNLYWALRPRGLGVGKWTDFREV